jgi:hypothetical protein
MEYRGIQYTVVQTANPTGFKWTAHFVGGRIRTAQSLAKAIEVIIDPSAPSEERAQRRRRLTRGPTEFREDRVDLAEAKRK